MGGIVYIHGNDASIIGSRFANGQAYHGGIVYLFGDYCNVTNSSFERGHAYSTSTDKDSVYGGGAIYSVSSYSNVYYSNFTYNIAEANGGGILWYGGANSQFNTVVGCNFINNTAYAFAGLNTKGGGAIFWSLGGYNGVVKNSTFIGNIVNSTSKADGGAILWDRSYNGILDNCYFDGNCAYTTNKNQDWTQGGACLLRSGNFTISNCVIKNSVCSKEAGGIYFSNNNLKSGYVYLPKDIRMINVTLINNTVLSLGSTNNNGGGGAQVKECKNAYLLNVTFINNTANKGGGLVIFEKAENGVIVENCTFIGNEASENGGNIWAASSLLKLYNAKIIGGVAANIGGGLYTNYLEYNNLTFINNTARIGGGLYFYNRGNSDPIKIIKNITFINNTATEGGGAIYVPYKSTITDNVFIGNKALNSASGGAIYINANPVTISKNNFTNNSAYNGSAIFSNFAGNANNIDISYNNFTGNTAYYGGAIYTPKVSGKIISISHSSFSKNHAFLDGGAIYAAGFNSNNNYHTISLCNFTNNTADRYGGAIYIGNNNHKVLNCIFEGNNASDRGGAIYVADYNNILIQDSTFVKSYAGDGGAVYYYASLSNPNLKIENCTFIKNIAYYNGGAVLYLINSGLLAYRDYNNFDGRGVILPSKRTDVTMQGTTNKFISESLFELNEDYEFAITHYSDIETPVITVYLDRPRDIRSQSIYLIANLTDSTGHLVQQVIVTEENFTAHYNPYRKQVFVTFRNLKVNETYNITVGFMDENYMYKETNITDQAHGTLMGDFQVLQALIERQMRDQASQDHYEIYLITETRSSYVFTPFGPNGEPLDDRCINLTNVDKPMIIHGQGVVIDAKGYCRVFNITSNDITFLNVEFINGNANGTYGDPKYRDGDIGGGIYWAGQNGTLINCLFDNNVAKIGGGLYYNSSALGAKIINTTFSNNYALTNGGAIDCNASGMVLTNTRFISNHANYGAALCREINATGGKGFNNTFIDNVAETSGAALAWLNATNISIDTYYFYGNSAGFTGGAIYVGEGSKNCEIINCVFGDNYVNDPTGYGGAIEWHSEKGKVVNSTFYNNRAYDGGAIYVGSESGEINITNSTFRENHAVNYGGAINIEASSVTVNGSNFYDNTAIKGGALYVGGSGTTNYVYSSVFKGNKAIGTGEDMNGLGGAIDWVASSGYIIDSEFTSNCADYGGGVYFGGKSDKSVITNCVFTDNHAKYNGGAIDCNASSMYLTNTLFDGNYAQFGAALCRETHAKSGSGENNTFKNNHAYVSGAALGWMGSVGIKITNYTFINNSADVSGGAIYVSPDSHNCSVIDCNFVDNYVSNKTIEWNDQFNWIAWDGTEMTYTIQYLDKGDPLINKTRMYPKETVFYYEVNTYPEELAVGGAMNILASNATIKNTNFTGNTARLGGGIYVGAESGNTIINVSVWRNNVAYERGGAINLHASGVHIDDGKFYDNLAINGSALYVGGVGTENKVHESIFVGNNATGYGGGIYWIAHEGEIVNSSFTRNLAEYGGGIYLDGRSSNTNITNTNFTSNTALKNGGAIECNATHVGIYNLIFDSNIAGEYGAALCREIGATSGNGSHNLFKNNHAGIAGAALAWMGVDNIHIIDYTFIDNTAGDSGGAIYIAEGSDNDIIENCTFEGNHLTNMSDFHYGGAIDCRGENLTIDTVIFTNNGAFTGGAIYVGTFSKDVHIFDSNFTSNYAYGDGGAIGFNLSIIQYSNPTLQYVMVVHFMLEVQVLIILFITLHLNITQQEIMVVLLTGLHLQVFSNILIS